MSRRSPLLDQRQLATTDPELTNLVWSVKCQIASLAGCPDGHRERKQFFDALVPKLGCLVQTGIIRGAEVGGAADAATDPNPAA
jgi:hypothetical protein